MRKRFKISMVFFAIVCLNEAIAQNNLTLSIVCDQYKSEISWELLNSNDNVVADRSEERRGGKEC